MGSFAKKLSSNISEQDFNQNVVKISFQVY